eukprot:Blabericola_migrator_1__1260@NODE_1326_length_4795_cov_131_834179_g891_i0_p1_GENE_NODE_1326_length_4795_cov_131_834179_g891_i0NODE_1326_length_4795_cov_131_834179_g891_i0_p1_ORF_typecomplete_len1083_score179_98AKAP7_NLS/PF10469_9/1_6e112_5_RNA_ligase2/PF13563_6/6_7e052_5_RNA_ligase2/PF13563_6/2e03_NODE_1326_length_4795_cov_131_834179_g891_i0913249
MPTEASPKLTDPPIGSDASDSGSSTSSTRGIQPPPPPVSTIQRPIFNLALNKLQSDDNLDITTPQSTRRQVSSKLQKFVNFFERSAFVRAKSIDDVDLTEENPVIPTVQTARATLGLRLPITSAAPISPPKSGDLTRMGSVRDIIKRFDPEGGELSARSLRREPSMASESGLGPSPASSTGPVLKRAATLQPSALQPCSVIGSGGAPLLGSGIKWQQVERRIDGKVVGKVWRKIERPTSLPPSDHAGIKSSVHTPPSSTELHDDNRTPTVPNENTSPSGGVTIPQQPESLLLFDPIGEGDEENLSEEDDSGSDYSCTGEGGSQKNGVASNDARVDSSSGNDRKKKRRETATSDDANKTKRASHFVAIRIDDRGVIDSVSRFQGELLHSAPFLDHCKSNINKLHLTLLVLSLAPQDIPRAKQALQLGVQRFMKAKTGILEAHRAAGVRDELQYMDGQRKGVPSDGQGCDSAVPQDTVNPNAAFSLDFRTIGAFGTRVLFLSPPLRQRLLLQQFHIELARAFGECGISIVGAGSGWNSAMEIQKQVLAHSDESVPQEVTDSPANATAIPHRKSMDSTAASSASTKLIPPSLENLPPRTAILPSVPLMSTAGRGPSAAAPPQPMGHSRVYPESATPLDKMLLRQYDLSSARTTLYIPQITLFKISKAAKRTKGKSSGTPHMPKLKLFPRLYHNLVQRVLQNGLPAPRTSNRTNMFDGSCVTPVRNEQVYPPNPQNHQQQQLATGVTPTCVNAGDASALDGSAPQQHTTSSPNHPAAQMVQHYQSSPQNIMSTQHQARSQYLGNVAQKPSYSMYQASYTPTSQSPLPRASPPSPPNHTKTTGSSPGSAAATTTLSPSAMVPSTQSSRYQYFAAPSPPTAPFYQPYFSSPNDQVLMLAAAAHQAFQQEALRRYQQDDRNLFWHPMCIQQQQDHYSPASYQFMNAHHTQGGVQHISHHNTDDPSRRNSYADKRGTAQQAASSAPPPRQRLKLDKVITTSRAPTPPFGCQSCTFVELLEMSQMDPDGYYKRICRTLLTPNADIIDNLIFLPPNLERSDQ